MIVPQASEKVVQDFDRAVVPFSEDDVKQALSVARQSLQNPTESENFGAWAELLAFALADAWIQRSPWGTYFGPMASGTDREGKTVYFPDIVGADADVIAHWSARAMTVVHPILKARYADLVWDMSPVIAKSRRNPEMATLAIDAYLASVAPEVRPERHDRFVAARRALDLAIMIHDSERTVCARIALLQLHREVMAAHESGWWIAFDRLIEEKNAYLTDAESQQLVVDLEELVLFYGDVSKPKHFNPHALQDAAKRLIRHHTRLRQPADVKRLQEAIARAFEHFASLGDAMLAAAVLQTSVNAYRDAGLVEDSRRARVLMEEKIGQSRSEMKSFSTEIKIPREDMEAFLKTIVVDDFRGTFTRIAFSCLPNCGDLERQIQRSLKEAPLMAMMPQKIMADDHIAAKIGSVEDDPFGRLIRQATIGFGFDAIWLQAALSRAIETNALTLEHFVGWANRFELFDDLTFLIEGVTAWLEGDFIKAVHVLMPQIEQGLRAIVGKLGKPVTKPHAKVADVGVAVNMGDILYNPELTEALGPDLTLYFLALYADPRGINLRNQVAHGLIKPDQGTPRGLTHRDHRRGFL